jgi:hypothetical protein
MVDGGWWMVEDKMPFTIHQSPSTIHHPPTTIHLFLIPSRRAGR